ncbi:MAG TPA: hypothetical protein DEA55_10195, partial [Rhodospirillaceae bacterium]|nr:hypothetical protein [Rhodospirillaceae bacterium]
EAPSGGAVRAGAEFISPMLGGLILGYFLDKWLDTAPIFIISLFLLGVAGGFISIFRASMDNPAETEDSGLHKPEKDAKTSARNDKQE